MDKIICLGNNYAGHALAPGEIPPSRPVVFLKPPSVLKCAGKLRSLEVPLSRSWGEVLHELEFVIKISRPGYQLSVEESKDYIAGVTLGLDMTIKELQKDLKMNGHPWTLAKVFPGSAIVGPWKEVDGLEEAWDLPFTLKVNGQLRQKASISDMLYQPFECVSYASQFFPLCEGDLIFTGTPVGVGKIEPGDTVLIEWGKLEYRVTWSEGILN